MNRRSFFWFLPALPAALIAKPANSHRLILGTVKNHSLGPNHSPNCRLCAQRVADMARRGGAYSKAIRG